MKNDSKPSYLDEMVTPTGTWSAQIDTSMVRFDKGMDLGIDFHNRIDPWTKLEYTFSQQIKQQQAAGDKTASSKHRTKLGRKDLIPLFYSMREQID